MTAIITDVHYRMSLALIRDLSEADISVTVCEKKSICDNKKTPPLGFYSKYINESVVLSDENYIKQLYELCGRLYSKEGKKPCLFTVGRETLSALSEKDVYEEFLKVCCMCIPDSYMLAKFNDKEIVRELAEELLIPVPKTYICLEDENPAEFFKRIPMPVVVKPAFGEKFGITAKDRYAIAKTSDEALSAYRKFIEVTGEAPIVQEYLNGDGFGCSILAKNGEIIISLCHRRIREYPVSGGPSACCLSVDMPVLREHASKMVKAVNYTGVAMFEFKSNKNGELFLLEINPRIWGSFPLTRAAKSDFSLCWYKAASVSQRGGEADFSPYSVKNIKDEKIGKKMNFTASDVMSAVEYIKCGKIKKALGAIIDIINPFVRDGLWEWSDIKPGIEYYKAIFRKGKQ